MPSIVTISTFLTGGICVHGHFFLKIFRGLFEREFTEREFHIHFHTKRAKPHEIVNDLARVRTVIE